MSAVEQDHLFKACDDLAEHLHISGGEFYEHEVRPVRPGEIGLLIHGAVTSYCRRDPEFDGSFESYVCRTFADHTTAGDPRRNLLLVAERRGGLAGSILMTQVSDHSATIRLLSVHFGHQGCGVGSTLVREAEKWAAEHGCLRISAQIRESDHGPTFYSKHGWALSNSATVVQFGQQFELETWTKGLNR
jgi:predicted N-acetyltransferase YhbS